MECIVVTDHCLGDNKFILGFCGNKTKIGPALIILSLNLMVIIFCFICPSLEGKYEFKFIEIILSDTGSGSIFGRYIKTQVTGHKCRLLLYC